MAKKWSYDDCKYVHFKEPEGSSTYADDIKEEMTCPECEQPFIYEKGHCSLVILSRFGVPFVVCEECHKWEEVAFKYNESRKLRSKGVQPK